MSESQKSSRRTFLQNVAAGTLAVSLGHAGHPPRATGSTLQASKWRPLGLGGYGHMLTPAISPDPDVMVVNCDMGGAYYTRNGGLSWELFSHDILQSNVQCRPTFHPDFQKNRLLISGSAWGKVRLVCLPENGALPFVKEISSLDDEGNFRLQGELAIDPADPIHLEDQRVMLVGATNESNFSGLRLFESEEACQGIGLNASSKEKESDLLNQIWRSVDGGKSWKCAKVNGGENLINSGFVLGFHFDQRENTKRILAVTQRKLFVSFDAGANWKELETTGLPLDLSNKNDVIRSFAGASRKNVACLYLTIPNRCIESGMSCDDRCDDATRVGLYRSSDGETWEPMQTNGMEDVLVGECDKEILRRRLQFHQVLACNSAPRTVYAFSADTDCFNTSKHSQAFRSDDMGSTWRPAFLAAPVPEASRNVDLNWWSAVTGHEKYETPSGVAICPSDPERVIATGTRCFVRSQNRWRCGDSPTSVAEPRRTTKWECNGLTVTAAWNYVIDVKHAPERHFIAYTDCGYARSENAGQSWVWLGDAKENNKEDEKEKWKLNAYDLILDPRQPGHMWAAFSAIHDFPNLGYIWRQNQYDEASKIGRIGYSHDAGETWHYGLNTKGDDIDAPVTSIVRGPEQNSVARLYATVYANERHAGGVYVSDDDGCCWQRLEIPGLPPGKEVRYWQLSLHADGTLFLMITGRLCGNDFANGEAGVYRLQPGACRWQLLGRESPLRWPRGFSVDPRDSRQVLVAASEPAAVRNTASKEPEEGGAYRLSTDGTCWERLPIKRGFRCFDIQRHATRPNWIYVTSNGSIGRTKNDWPGIWFSDNGGQSFKPMHDFPFRNVHRVVTDPQDPDSIYVCTSGAGVWHGPAKPDG